MSERSVSVRLVAITQQYNDAMKAAGTNTRNLGTEAELMGTKSTKAKQSVDSLGNSIQAADKKARDAKPSFSALGLSVLALGPALIPVAGLAVAGAGALGGMGAAGLLAFGGIKAEMASGTTLGNTYAAQLLLLKGNLTTLQHTAASGVLSGFETAVADVQAQMPFLNASVATFSTLAGKSGANLEQGLVSSLHTLMPLFVEVGSDVESLTARFATWSAGGGLQKFSDWAQANLPTIEHDLGLVTSAVGHLVDGMAPLGGIALGELGIVARAINALPVSVLQTLIPLLVEGYLAFKAYQGLSAVGDTISAFTAKLQASAAATMNVGKHAAPAAEGVAAIGPASLLAGVGLGVAAVAFNTYEKNAEAATAQTSAFKDALVTSKGAIDANVLSMTAEQLQQDGLAGKAAKAGISLTELTTAVTGTDDQFAQMFNTWRKNGDVSMETEANIVSMRMEFAKAVPAAQQLSAANKAFAASTAPAAAAATQNAAQIAALGKRYDATAAEVQAFADANKITLTGQAAQTKQFETAADKAALAGTAVSILADDVRLMGSSLVTADTQMSDFLDALKQESTIAGGDAVRSQESLQSSLNSTADTLKAGKGAFDAFSDAGLASRGAVDASATAAGNYAAQIFKQTGSVQDAVTAYGHWYDALIATGKQQGVGKQQIDAYLQSVGQLPGQVSQALTGTSDAGAQAAKQMTDAMTSGISAGLQPLVDELDGLLSVLGQAALLPAYQSGAAVGSAFTAGLKAYISTGTPSGSTYNDQVPGQSASVTKAYVAPVIKTAAVPTFGGLHTGSLTPPSASSSASAAKSAATAAADAIKAAQQAIVDRDDLLAAQATSAIDPTNKLALAQAAVTDATRRLNNETTKGTTAYYTDLTNLHQAAAALTAERLAEAQAVATAQGQLATDTKAETDLLAQEAATTAQFYSDLSAAAATHAANDNALLAGRTTALEGWASAANVATVSWGSSLTWLTSNVQDQVDQFDQWASLLAQARANGVSDDVISALGLDQGPQAIGQLEQFATATKAQIDALNAAVAAKNAAAGKETQVEAANNYGDLGQALLSEQQSYANAVVALQTKFSADMAALAAQVATSLATIKTDTATLASLPGSPTAPITSTGTGSPAAPVTAGSTAHYSLIPNPAALKALPAGTPLFTYANGTYSQIANGAALAALPPGTNIYDRTFDTGGMLMPGLTFAHNKTGKPEHILTGDQFNALLGGQEITVNSIMSLDGQIIDQRIERVALAQTKRRNLATAVHAGGSYGKKSP